MSDDIQDIKLELFENQSEIIRLQSEVIDELYRLLAQHMEADELDHIPAVNKINQAAALRSELEL